MPSYLVKSKNSHISFNNSVFQIVVTVLFLFIKQEYIKQSVTIFCDLKSLVDKKEKEYSYNEKNLFFVFVVCNTKQVLYNYIVENFD